MNKRADGGLECVVSLHLIVYPIYHKFYQDVTLKYRQSKLKKEKRKKICFLPRLSSLNPPSSMVNVTVNYLSSEGKGID